jgi:hypothetical protein
MTSSNRAVLLRQNLSRSRDISHRLNVSSPTAAGSDRELRFDTGDGKPFPEDDRLNTALVSIVAAFMLIRFRIPMN